MHKIEVTPLLASRASRLLASEIDFAIVAIIAILPIYWVVLGSGIVNFMEAKTIDVSWFVENFLYVVWLPMIIGFSVIQSILLLKARCTIGKFLLNIRIASDPEVKFHPLFQILFMRTLLPLFMGSIPFFSTIDPLFIFGQKQKCVHDYMAKTTVVQRTGITLNEKLAWLFSVLFPIALFTICLGGWLYVYQYLLQNSYITGPLIPIPVGWH